MFELGTRTFETVKECRGKDGQLVRRWRISAEKWNSKKEPNENSRTKKCTTKNNTKKYS